MKIAVASIVFKTTPPKGYGGIERVVYLLVEELVRQGHDVTLFATPGSYCSGRTIEVAGYDPTRAPSGHTKTSDVLSEEPLYKAMWEHLEENPVDIIHDWSFQNLFVQRHGDRFPFVISTCIPQPPGYSRPNLVACSRAHAKTMGGTAKYVHYGLDLKNYEYSLTKKDHFIHIAKIAPYKGQHLAVLAARKTGRKLMIAGNIENNLYYYGAVKPLLLVSPNVTYIGEINGVNRHLRDARCLVQTPRWFDAFPLVILEAFASGTPVIAFPEGGIPEQIVDGINGFICKGVDGLARSMEDINRIKPEDCRAIAEERYSVTRMAHEYIELYGRVIDKESW